MHFGSHLGCELTGSSAIRSADPQDRLGFGSQREMFLLLITT